jgi:DNA-binding LacI/PurR family transcriptional regulator
MRAAHGAERPPNLMEVAAVAGVSHQTVSRVLNNSPSVARDTRAKVLAAIEQLGYRRNHAARTLITRRSGRIGMISAHLEFHGPRSLATAVQEAVYKAGYEFSLVGISALTRESFKGAFDRMRDDDVEGLVVALPHVLAVELMPSRRVLLPTVIVQGVEAGQVMAAGIDQELGAAKATRHLLDLGHRRIVHVSGQLEWVEAQQRIAGWRRAHDERNLLPGQLIQGDWSAASGFEAGLRIALDEEVTAVFAANDAMALGVLHAMHSAGRSVPDSISVVGFDDSPEAALFWPALTTVNQDFAQQGRNAVDLTMRALAGERAPKVDLIQPALNLRASTATVRSSGLRQFSAAHESRRGYGWNVSRNKGTIGLLGEFDDAQLESIADERL